MSWHRWVVAAASRLVPRALRAEWRAEWEAELQHRETVHDRWARPPARSRLDLLRRSAGAFADAWWLQTNSWSFYRVFRQHWRLVTPAVLALASAVAAVVVGLAAYNALLLRLPGVTDQESLRFVNAGPPSQPLAPVSLDDYNFYREHLQAFSDVAAFESAVVGGVGLTAGNHQERVTTATCSSNLFTVLGVVPVRGRLAFDPPQPGGPDEVVISEALWRRLGTTAGEVGATIDLDNRPTVIIGVLPTDFRGFEWDLSPDLWRPIPPPQPPMPGGWRRRTPQVHMIARLAPHVTAAQAVADLRLTSGALDQDTPGSHGTHAAVLSTVNLVPPSGRADAAATLGGLLLATLVTLLVACANVTNLLLALGASRRKEVLVRVALGASRAQLFVPLFREGALLGLMAGLLGYGAASLGLAWLSAVRLSRGRFLPSLTLDVHADVGVLVASLAVAFLAGAAAGMLPALRATADGFSGTINRDLGTHRVRKARVRTTLVVVQMAVAVLALAGVGMSMESLVNVHRAPLAFSSAGRRLLFADVNLMRVDGSQRAAIETRARKRLAATPGIESASLATSPLGARLPGRLTVAPADANMNVAGGIPTPFTFVDDHYFATVDIPVIDGRNFSPADRASTREVAIVNTTLAHQMWPGRTAIGRQLRLKDRDGERLVEVVGVAADAKYFDPIEPQRPFLYLVLAQHPRGAVCLTVRTSSTFVSPPRSLVRQVLSTVDPAVRASTVDVLTVDDLLATSLMMPRVVVAIVITLGAITLLLALFGLYGSVCYSVTQRRPEMGVRVALGAGPGNLFAIVLRHAGAVALAGAGLGLVAARIVLPAVSSFFYGVRPIDAGILGLVALTSVVIALGTAYAVARPWIRLAATDLLRP